MQSNPKLKKEDLIGLCMDFFEAGGETVGSTLSWVFLYFALYPETQEKCFKEIEDVLGSTVPGLDDRTKLPYTEATIMEIQRLSCVAPGGLEHKAMHNTKLQGYDIPEGTMLFYNIFKFHHDPDVWEDPEIFRPERFLSEDGAKVVKKEQFIPFGFGKRVCMGESLAKAELLIFTVMLLQRLKISAPKDRKRPDPQDSEAGITRAPKSFYVHVDIRT